MALDWRSEYHRYQYYFLNVGHLYRVKRFRVYTGIVLSFFTISFFLFFAIKPTVVTITGLIKTLKDQKLVAQKLDEKINTLNLAQQQYTQVQNDLPLIEEALPNESKISTLVKQLEILAYQSGVNLEGVQFAKVTIKEKNPSPKNESVKFNLAISGEYQNLYQFLKNLSVLRRVILIDGYAFKTGKTEKSSLSLIINAKTFYGVDEK